MTNDTFDPNTLWGERETVGPDPDEVQPVSKSFVRILIATGTILVLSGIAVVLVINGWDGENPKPARTVAGNSSDDHRNVDPIEKIGNAMGVFDAPPTNHKDPSIDWKAEEKKVASKSAIKGLRRKLNATRDLISSVQDTKSELGSQIELLKASEAGARIASNSEHIESFIWIENEYDSLEIGNDEASEFVGDMLGFLQKVESRDDGSYTPQPFVSERLRGFTTEFEAQRKQLRELQEALNSVVTAASGLKPSGLLDVALEKTKADHAATLAKRIAMGAKEGREQATADLAEETKATNKDLATSKINLENARRAKDALANNADAAQIQAKLEIKKENDRIAAANLVLEQEFQRELADIRTYLAPFLADGRHFRGESPGSGPISYSLLIGGGVLDRTPQGLYNLGVSGYKCGRPLGGFPGVIAVDRMKTGHPQSEPTARFLERSQ